MGGIGKTVLATALARDPAVRTKFTYGVAWLTFGRGASALPVALIRQIHTAGDTARPFCAVATRRVFCTGVGAPA
jgi:hypothetical protein